MNDIKVSVIIPVYNTEKYLRQCLDSVVNQTLKEIEIICVDDGSTDSSPAILDEYAEKDNRIKILHQQNQYAGVARNRGMEIAQGEYLYFLDSDDFMDPNLLEKTYTQAKTVGDADIVLFGGKKYDVAKQKYIEAPYLFHRDLLPDQSAFSRKDLPGTLLRLTTPCPWTKLFRRSFLKANKLFFQPFRNSNDVFFVFVSLSLASVITFVDADLVCYRVGQSDNLQSIKDEYPTLFADAYESVYYELKKRNIYSDVKAGFVNQTIAGCTYNLNTVKSNKARMQICERLQSPSFTEMGLLDYPDEYYINLNDVRKLRGTKNAVEWHEKLNRPQSPGFRVLRDSRQTNITPAVSVIIPVYNTEPWLRPCLDSILNQTLQNIEILCVDDGSTDESRKILLEYAAKDKRIVVFSQNNSGQSVARNQALKQALGTYIYFMDSDDLLAIDALEKMIQQADRDNLDALCFGGEAFADAPELESQLTRFNYTRDFSYLPSSPISGSDLLVQSLQHHDFKCSPCLILFRRDIFSFSHLKFYENIIHEDEIFAYEILLSAKRVGYTTEAFFYRRLRNESTMTKKTNFSDAYGYFICYLEMTKFADQLDIQDLTAEFVWLRPKDMLRSARRDYAKLSVDERECLWGLPWVQRILFQSLIVDYCDQQNKENQQRQDKKKLQSQLKQQKSENKKLQTNLKDQKSANKKLRKELKAVKTSRSFKIGRFITWLPRKIRDAFRRYSGN